MQATEYYLLFAIRIICLGRGKLSFAILLLHYNHNIIQRWCCKNDVVIRQSRYSISHYARGGGGNKNNHRRRLYHFQLMLHCVDFKSRHHRSPLGLHQTKSSPKRSGQRIYPRYIISRPMMMMMENQDQVRFFLLLLLLPSIAAA